MSSRKRERKHSAAFSNLAFTAKISNLNQNPIRVIAHLSPSRNLKQKLAAG
jgi:hypothetical protein